MKHEKLDEADRRILNLLMRDGRMSIKEIAREVYMSSPAVSARIQELERAGFITGYQAMVDPVALGYHVKAYVHLEVAPEDKKRFYPFVRRHTNVVECDCVTGDYSMVLTVLFESTVQLDQFIGELQVFGRTKTLIVFSTSVEHRGPMLEVENQKAAVKKS